MRDEYAYGRWQLGQTTTYRHTARETPVIVDGRQAFACASEGSALSATKYLNALEQELAALRSQVQLWHESDKDFGKFATELIDLRSQVEALTKHFGDANKKVEALRREREQAVEALARAGTVLEALHYAGGTGVQVDIAAAVVVVRRALGIPLDASLDAALRATGATEP